MQLSIGTSLKRINMVISQNQICLLRWRKGTLTRRYKPLFTQGAGGARETCRNSWIVQDAPLPRIEIISIPRPAIEKSVCLTAWIIRYKTTITCMKLVSDSPGRLGHAMSDVDWCISRSGKAWMLNMDYSASSQRV